MALFERIKSGALRNSKTEPLATVATVATHGGGVAGVAGVAEGQKIKPLTIAEQKELRRLVTIACEPHERDEMYDYAIQCGINSLTTYQGIVADKELDLILQERNR